MWQSIPKCTQCPANEEELGAAWEATRKLMEYEEEVKAAREATRKLTEYEEELETARKAARKLTEYEEQLKAEREVTRKLMATIKELHLNLREALEEKGTFKPATVVYDLAYKLYEDLYQKLRQEAETKRKDRMAGMVESEKSYVILAMNLLTS